MISWDEAVERSLDANTTLIVGLPDTGKTTFFRAVLSSAKREQKKVGLIDGDLGQKTIGPPCTAGLVVSTLSVELNAIYFVGDTTPALRPLEAALAVRRLADRARALGCPSVVVDTSGLVRGDLGSRLKTAKAELLSVDSVVVLEKEKELSSLARVLTSRGTEVMRIQAPAGVKGVPARERAANRSASFAEYFRRAKTVEISLEQTAILMPDSLSEANEGLLVGLLDEGWNTLVMGIFVQALDDRLIVVCPSVDVDKVRLVKPGSLKILRDGTETGRVR